MENENKISTSVTRVLWPVWFLILFSAFVPSYSFGFETGHKIGVTPDGLSDPAYTAGVSAKQSLANGFSLYGSLSLDGVLDLSVSGSDRLTAEARILYKLGNGSEVTLSRRQVTISGDGQIFKTLGGNATGLTYTKNF